MFLKNGCSINNLCFSCENNLKLKNDEVEMTRNEIITLCISCFALGWNVYRDVFNKPKIKIRIDENSLGAGTDNLQINITNEGPGSIEIRRLAVRRGGKFKQLLKQTQKNCIDERADNSGFDRLPIQLGEYEDCDLLVDPIRYEKYLLGDHIYIGIIDSLKRTHWAKYK